jgi:FAD/FMN-containing dehydrogenase
MGKGSRLPARHGFTNAPHSIALRIGDGRVSTSPEATEAARYDFSPVPGLPGRVFSRTPEGVVRPASAQEAADTVGVCFEERTRVVARGSATGGLGGVVPVRGGVVVDLAALGGVLDIDSQGATATVGAGAIWGDVIEVLGREGFAPLACPSSSSGSTVGGWVSSGGYGAGTLRHGNFHAHIKTLQVGLPSGFLVEATGGEGRYSIPSFAGTEGQIGIVTSAKFSVKRAPERRATYVVRLSRFEDGIHLYRKLADLDSPPHSVDLVSRGAAVQFGAGWDSPCLLVTEEGDVPEVERLAGALKELLAGSSFEIDASFDAHEFHKTRLSALRGGGDERPFYSGGVLIGTDGLDRLVSYIMNGRTGDGDLALECRAVDRGTNLVTAGYRAGGEDLSPMRAFALARGAVAAGAAMGGVPYGVGLWNSPYIDVILGSRKKGLRRIKSDVDRLRIMNPGKFFSMTTRSGLPVPGWALRAYLGVAGRS